MTQGSLAALLLPITSLIVLRMQALMTEFPFAATKRMQAVASLQNVLLDKTSLLKNSIL
jgi:hypothetical protein